jgi:hypothetical protein
MRERKGYNFRNIEPRLEWGLKNEARHTWTEGGPGKIERHNKRHASSS